MTSQRHIPAEVLDATRASVLAVGVRRTTLTEVARRAGVSRMTLYRRVPDVTALVLEVVGADLAALIRAVEGQAGGLPTARERLVSTAVGVVHRLPDEPLLRRVLDVEPEILLPYLTDRMGSTQRLALGHVRRLLAEGIADGSVRAGDAEASAWALLLTVTAHVVSARVVSAETDRPALLAELRRQLDAWLAPEAAPRPAARPGGRRTAARR